MSVVLARVRKLYVAGRVQSRKSQESGPMTKRQHDEIIHEHCSQSSNLYSIVVKPIHELNAQIWFSCMHKP